MRADNKVQEVLQQAQAARSQGNVKRAIDLLEKGIRINPQSAEIWAALGGARYSTKDLQGAVKALQQSVRLAPEWAAAWCQLAGTLLACDSRQAAIDAARTAWSLDEGRWQNGITYLQALHTQEKDAESLSLFEQLCLRFPLQREIWLERIFYLQTHRRWLESEAVIRQALDKLPQDAGLYVVAGQFMLQMERPVEAEAVLAYARKLEPDDIRTKTLHAKALSQLRRTEEALSLLRSVYERNSDNQAVILDLARLLRDSDRLIEAENLLKTIVADHDATPLAVEYASVLIEKGDVRAFSRAEAILQFNASYHDLRDKLAWSRYACGEDALDYQAAIDALPSGVFRARHSLAVLDVWSLLNREQRGQAWERFATLPSRQENANQGSGRNPQMTLLLPIGRSGSLFVHSLFDGHPQLTTLPGIYFKGFFGAEVWQRLHTGTTQADWRLQLVKRFLYHYMTFFDASRPNPVFGRPMSNPFNLGKNTGLANMGEMRDVVMKIDEPRFAQCLYNELKAVEDIDAGHFFVMLHRAYAKYQGCEAAGDNIFYHIHNPDFFEMANCLAHFPQSRVLYVVREPVQALESWFRVCWPDNEAAPPEIIVKSWETMARMLAIQLQTSRSLMADHLETVAVRLEDIKRAPEKTLRALCGFMEIDWHPSLLESTFMGHAYWGPESKLSPNVRGFDQQSLNRKVGVLFSERDAEILGTLFYPVSVAWGYREADHVGFLAALERLEPLLDEPFDFERRLFERIGTDYGIALPDLIPFRAMRTNLKRGWQKLRSGVAFNNILPLLKNDAVP